jgi:hypothetical protein
VNRPGAALRRRPGKLNFGHDRPRGDVSTVANDDEDENKCRDCGGEGVDAHGFDCTTCFGTGKIEDDE